MARYYEESALIELIKNKQLIFEESTPVDEAIASQIDAVVEGIGELPTADVVPRAELEDALLVCELTRDRVTELEKVFAEIDRIFGNVTERSAFHAIQYNKLKKKYIGDGSSRVSAPTDDGAIARQILSEIREAYEKYGGKVGMKLKIEELEEKFKIQNAELRVVEAPTPTKEN